MQGFALTLQLLDYQLFYWDSCGLFELRMLSEAFYTLHATQGRCLQ